MPLDNPRTIDIVTKTADGQGAELIIYDGGEVPEPSERFERLQEKLRAYAVFVEGGQFKEKLPGVSPDKILIRVVCKQTPTEVMRQVSAVKNTTSNGLALPVVVETEEEYKGRTAKKQLKPWWRFW